MDCHLGPPVGYQLYVGEVGPLLLSEKGGGERGDWGALGYAECPRKRAIRKEIVFFWCFWYMYFEGAV